MSMNHHDHIHVAASGVGDAMAVPLTDKVVVDREALRDYLEEYHHRHYTGRCKADGQDWPCDTYKALREAVDE